MERKRDKRSLRGDETGVASKTEDGEGDGAATFLVSRTDTEPLVGYRLPQVEPVKIMRSGETRAVLITGKGAVQARVGVAIVWMGK